MRTESTRKSWDAPPELPPTHYLDNRIYTDDAIFRAEQEKIFYKTWKFACHESELRNPGDYRVVDIGAMSIIVLRDVDRKIRAFFNACPHRGARLVRDTAGTVAGHRVQCFYHHWSFSTQGECLHIPRHEAYANSSICREKIALRAVRAESVLGLVFVNLDDEAGPISQFLGSTLENLRDPLGELELLHYHRVEIHANWKLFVETNCEGYHELLHLLNRTTGLSQPAYRKRLWHLHRYGHHTFEPAQIAYNRLALGERASATLPGMTANGHVVVDLFPDAMVNVRATVVRIDSLTPLAPGLTVLECRGLGRMDDSEEIRELRIRHHNQVWGPFGRNLPEDIWAVETQWANMVSGASRFSIIAREEERQATDDAPLRSFYGEWRRLLGVYSHDVDERYRVSDDMPIAVETMRIS
jgi:phenylpropionate dioxygenase-like ring-hydroxylating dioxygenase large terminal subunit